MKGWVGETYLYFVLHKWCEVKFPAEKEGASMVAKCEQLESCPEM